MLNIHNWIIWGKNKCPSTVEWITKLWVVNVNITIYNIDQSPNSNESDKWAAEECIQVHLYKIKHAWRQIYCLETSIHGKTIAKNKVMINTKGLPLRREGWRWDWEGAEVIVMLVVKPCSRYTRVLTCTLHYSSWITIPCNLQISYKHLSYAYFIKLNFLKNLNSSEVATRKMRCPNTNSIS